VSTAVQLALNAGAAEQVRQIRRPPDQCFRLR